MFNLEFLRDILQQRKLSVYALEKQAGLKRGAIQNILLGRSVSPSITMVQAIASALEVPIDSLIKAPHTEQEKNKKNLISYITDIILPKNSKKEETESTKENKDIDLFSNAETLNKQVSLKEIDLYVYLCLKFSEYFKMKNISFSAQEFNSLMVDIYNFCSTRRYVIDKDGLDNNRQLEAFVKRILLYSGNISLLTKVEKLINSSPFKGIFLSKREIEVLQGIARGRTIKEIAREMDISFRTVESFLNNIRQKTRLTQRSQLAEFFYENEKFINDSKSGS